MEANELFRFGEPLKPGEAAFTESLFYDDQGQGTVALETPGALVCASPFQTGKSTLINEYYRRGQFLGLGPDAEQVSIPIPEDGMSESELRQCLSDELDAVEADSVPELLKTSRRLYTSKEPAVLIFDEADNLAEDALQWLLRGLTLLGEREEIPVLHVIVSGSFALQRYTSGPNSDFPLPQIYMWEFEKEQQTTFLHHRLRSIDIQVSDKAYEEIWGMTLGDKYLTQVIGHLIESNLGPKAVVDVTEIKDCMKEYISLPTRNDPLKTRMLRGLIDLWRATGGSIYGLRRMIEDISVAWVAYLNNEAREIAYRSGIVRKWPLEVISPRSPMAMAALEPAFERINAAEMLVNSHFSLRGVHDEDQTLALDLLDRIYRAASLNVLTTLQVGKGVITKNDELEVEVGALDIGHYSGTWNISLHDHIPIGDGAWCFLFAVEVRPGSRVSEVEILRMKK